MDDLTFSASFGSWLRSRRRQLDLTQSELAKRANCSEATIRKIEADERKPSKPLAESLAVALELPATELEKFLSFARGTQVDEVRFHLQMPSHHLPVLLTSTIDRTHELAEVSSLLQEKHVHLVTLTGAPGIGKTRMAIQCGYELLSQFRDGVWFIDLSELSSAEFFLPTLSRGIPVLQFSALQTLNAFCEELRDKNLLLILDNFEQIVEGAALIVSEILQNCQHLKILVTSRIPLHIYGEHLFPLPPLSVPSLQTDLSVEMLMQYEAVQLFVARAQQHQPHFKMTPTMVDNIREICSVLDGIPLALELAAASLRRMSIPDLAGLLRSRDWLSEVKSADRDLPPRQQTMEAVIDWSYSLLSPSQQTFFRHLGIFRGWFDLEAVKAMGINSSATALSLLNELTDHSLLMNEPFLGNPHWRMLEVIREFALSKCTPQEKSQLAELSAHHFWTSVVSTYDPKEPKGFEEPFKIDKENVHAALNWFIEQQQVEPGFQLAGALLDAWSSLGYFQEGLYFLDRLLKMEQETDVETLAGRFWIAADFAWQQHNFPAALAYSNQAIELAQKHGLELEYPRYLNRLGRIYIEEGEYQDAKGVLEKALPLARQNPQSLNPGIVLAQLGEVSFLSGEIELAEPYFREALQSLPPESEIFSTIVRTDLAEICISRKEFEQARQWLVQTHEPAFRHMRRTLIYLCTLAGYLAFPSNSVEIKKKAAQFYGAIDSLGKRSGVVLSTHYQELNQARIAEVRRVLSWQEWQNEFETGRRWNKEEVFDRGKQALSEARNETLPQGDRK